MTVAVKTSMILRGELRAANSATQYPSIPTYHALDNGRITDALNVDFDGASVIVTEKLDGTNARIVAFPDGTCLIGSRTEWLTASGDLVANPNMGIVDAVSHVAEALGKEALDSGLVYALYGEVFGGKIQAHKQYTSTGVTSFRAFDAWTMPEPEFGSMLFQPLEEIAAWRDGGGQPFMDARALKAVVVDGEIARLVPTIGSSVLPRTPDETYEWLNAMIETTSAALDAGAQGRPEGVVVRTPNRSRIAKIRFEDYGRSLKRRSS